MMQYWPRNTNRECVKMLAMPSTKISCKTCQSTNRDAATIYGVVMGLELPLLGIPCSKRKALIGHKSVGDLQEPGTIQFCGGYTYKAKDDLYGKNYYLRKKVTFVNLYMVWCDTQSCERLVVQVHSSSKDCGSDSG